MTESDAASLAKARHKSALFEVETFSAQVMDFNIPTGVPLVYELDMNLRVQQKCPCFAFIHADDFR